MAAPPGKQGPQFCLSLPICQVGASVLRVLVRKGGPVTVNGGETMAWEPRRAGHGRKVGCYGEATQGLRAPGPRWQPSSATTSCVPLALPLFLCSLPPRAPSYKGPHSDRPLWPRGSPGCGPVLSRGAWSLLPVLPLPAPPPKAGSRVEGFAVCRPAHGEWNLLSDVWVRCRCLWGWVRPGPGPRKSPSSKSFLSPPPVHLTLCSVLPRPPWVLAPVHTPHL